ncbi:MAG: hypothetical protein IJZ53_05565 [Tyzzerella sp.]|nr:hypothetical protein [Tyzzerella sp.]
MKKVIASLLIMSAMVFTLTACGDEMTQSEETKKQETVVEQKKLTDPRGKTLTDTSTGETSPQLVETTYETTDVVVAEMVPTETGYAVDPTGETDSTEGLQKALYDCYNAGGGTVYLPAGNYAISDTIYIPPYVTLRGDWQDPDVGTEYGTIISVWMESEDAEKAGAFDMSTCSGAIGLTVYYPLQSMECIRPYPYTFYLSAQGVNTHNATIKNVTVINGYRGIGTPGAVNHESIQVHNVKGTFLCCGLKLQNGSEIGNVDNFVVNNKYWIEASADCMNAVPEKVINAYTKEYTTGLIFSDIEGYAFSDIYVDGCKVGMQTVKGDRANFWCLFYNMNITDCEQGVIIDFSHSIFGSVIAKSHIEGGLFHNSDGVIKLCDVEVVGEIQENGTGSVMTDDTDLSGYVYDYTKSYVKPTHNMMVANLPAAIAGDASSVLQNALDEMSAQGGGVVYVPAGQYSFRNPVTVPAGVEVKGCIPILSRSVNNINGGTVFHCYYGDDASNKAEDQAFITLAGENAGISGIRIVYPENSPKTDDLNTSYAVRGKAKGVYVVNCMISGAAYGIDFYDCDEHYIDGVVAGCYYNVFRLGGTGGTLARSLQNGSVITRNSDVGLIDWPGETEMLNVYRDGLLRAYCDYIVVEDAINQLIFNTFAYGTKTGITNINSENTALINYTNDWHGTTTPQFVIQGGSMTGVNLMRVKGYSFELEKGKIEFYNRLTSGEVGEKTVIREK